MAQIFAPMCDDVRQAKITTKPRFDGAKCKFYHETIPKQQRWKECPRENNTRATKVWENVAQTRLGSEFTTETGRLFFRRRTKQLPLARKPNVLGHVAKRTWAHSFVLSCSGFPSRFFWILSVVDLWLSLLVQHDMDKGYRLCFSQR